jgi:hypothetical protein
MGLIINAIEHNILRKCHDLHGHPVQNWSASLLHTHTPEVVLGYSQQLTLFNHLV